MGLAKIKDKLEARSKGGMVMLPSGTVVTTLADAQIPPPSGRVILGVTHSGAWVTLTNENCEAVEGG